MKRASLLILILLSFVVLLISCQEETDSLFESFQQPPAQAKPFVRWWWNGSAVTEQEILRELDVMAEAGIGGVEINTIGMPETADPKTTQDVEQLEWLSPEWNQMIQVAAKGAKERGMIADLIVGSGWPFGAEFLESGEQVQVVTVNRIPIRGPGVYREQLETLTEGYIRHGGRREAEKIETGSNPELLFLRLMPARPHQLEPAVDLMKSVLENGTVRFEVPEGEHILYAGSWREGHRRVVRGAKGASGPVVDHFNRDSVEKYLDRMSSRLTPTLGGDLGDHFRAMFCDSLELGQANWTERLTEEFEKRRGYSPGPYLHLMVDSEPVAGGTEFIDSVRRLRYDFNVTVIELFMENFMETFTGWCNRQGVKSRAQAYGRESHPVDTSFLVDLPEGETWIWGAEKYSRPTMINRYVASAAHLSGKRLVSSEAMTNPFTPFRVLPNLLKRTDDLNFLSGITHSVLHGYNYSPPEAGFPGWVQFGCYFSDQNSLWPYFKYWSTYNARVSQVLQSSDAQARVALFTPEADIWSEQGRLYLPFAERERPGYLWDVWEALHQNGFNAEYVSDAILSRAEVKNGQVQVGSRVYEAVILIDVKSLLPGTAERLMEFAEQGVKVAFVGERPYRSPSFRDATANDEIVRSSIGAALESETADLVGPPPEGGIVGWAGDVMSRFSVLPDVQISAPNSSLSQIYHRLEDRDIFFFVNSSETEAQSFSAKFATGRKVPWVWDPGTGQRRPYHWKESPAELKIHLDPLESLLLVFEAGSSGQAHPETRPSGESGLLLSPTWDVSFTHAITGEKFELSTDELIDLAESDETELSSFAGTIVYKASFESQDLENPWLDLGLVHGVSEVRLNGVPQGVRWYGRHLYNVVSGLKVGENQIEVKVTTHLGNYVRTLKDNPSAVRWASWYPLESLGLLGPVKLLHEGSAD